MNTPAPSPQSHLKPSAWGACLSVLCCFYHPMAQASIDVALRLDTHFGHNNNLFRTPPTPDVAPVGTALNGQSAEISAGIPLGSEQTRLLLTTTLGRVHFGGYPELSHSPQSTAASLPWRFTDVWQGHLLMGQSRSAYAFDAAYPRLDLIDRTWASAEVRMHPTPWISVPVQIAKQTVKHQDQTTHGLLDNQQQRISAALAYHQPSGSRAEFGVAHGTTDAPSAVSTRTSRGKDSDVFLDVQWAYSTQTQGNLRWTNRLRRFDFGPEGDRIQLYRMGISHTVSPLLRLDAQLWHQPVIATEARTANTTARGHRLGIQYTPNPKWALEVAWQAEQQDNRVFITPPQTPFSQQTHQLRVRGQYRLTQSLQAYIETGMDKRSQGANNSAQQRTVRAGVEYTFENIEGSGARNRGIPAPGF